MIPIFKNNPMILGPSSQGPEGSWQQSSSLTSPAAAAAKASTRGIQGLSCSQIPHVPVLAASPEGQEAATNAKEDLHPWSKAM